MILKEGINELGLFLSDAQIDQFQLYYNLLVMEIIWQDK